MRPATVYVIDDDSEVLAATGRLLKSAGLTVAAFQSPLAFLDAYDGLAGCLVLDLAMPEVTGLDLQHLLAERGGSLPIVFLTGRGDIRTCAEAMKEGAVDFLTKPVDESDLLAAVSRALERACALQRERGDRNRIESALSVLTPRERQVLDQVVAGRRNKQIAADLGTVEKTIKFHRGNLMKKLGARSVPDLVRLVQQASVATRIS
jgi:FixJ family two-component response regulator